MKASPRFKRAVEAELRRLRGQARTAKNQARDATGDLARSLEIKFGAGGTVGAFTRRLDQKKGKLVSSWSRVDDELEQLLRGYKAVRKQAKGRGDKLRLDDTIRELEAGAKHLGAAGRNIQDA